MNGNGALPSQLIKQISNLGQISINGKPINDASIQPASADLTVADWGYCVKSTFLPKANEKVEDVVKKYQLFKVGMPNGFALIPGATYVFKLNESLKLDKDIFAITSPKSSTGRINLWVRTLADNVARFDKIPAGYKGPLYIMVSPKSWPVFLHVGEALNQIRFFNSDTKLSNFELKLLHQEIGLLYEEGGKKLDVNDFISDDGVLLTADLEQDIVAYKAKNSVDILDLSKRNYYELDSFFTPIYREKNTELILERDSFYLLSTHEFVRIPTDYSGEMVAYDISSGEFRSHYAGFFDPGFGFGKEGEIKGRRGVLEIYPHENVILRHKQPVCKIVYERMLAAPDRVYGVDSKLGSHYHIQNGPQASKHFRNSNAKSKIENKDKKTK